MSCPECEIVEGKRHARGRKPLVRGAWIVHPRPEDAAVPGWWMIAPKRHVESFDALTPREQRSLGAIVGEVSAALRASTPTEKIYVSIFAEVLKHLHVHVIARPPDLAPEDHGPYIFLSRHTADARDVDEVVAKVAARLSGSASKSRSRKRSRAPRRRVRRR
ncbi:MAG TPA: HIT domain-containing protein [bacterium]|nr:HIT domain-containing protein [bacterium]